MTVICVSLYVAGKPSQVVTGTIKSIANHSKDFLQVLNARQGGCIEHHKVGVFVGFRATHA